MYWIMEVYMIEATSKSCFYKIIFINTTSLEYNSAVVDGAMLNFIKRNTRPGSLLNNSDLIMVVVKV